MVKRHSISRKIKIRQRRAKEKYCIQSGVYTGKNRTLYLSCKSKKRSRSSSGDYNDGVNKHFVIIDVKLVWHGGMNLLSKEGAWDNLMRIKSDQVAAELLEIALKNQENIKKG